MVAAKQVADLLTYMRGVIALILAWLGLRQSTADLPLAVWLLIASWTTDSLDGPLARRNPQPYQSWIGDHDLEIDMAVSGGVFIYMIGAGLIDLRLAAIYVLIWMLIFWRWGTLRSLGMLVQAPIYGWFIWVAVRDAPGVGWWSVVWILVAIIATWPRFPREVIPGFLDGMRAVWGQYKGTDD